jgi:hypothetical protein
MARGSEPVVAKAPSLFERMARSCVLVQKRTLTRADRLNPTERVISRWTHPECNGERSDEITDK